MKPFLSFLCGCLLLAFQVACVGQPTHSDLLDSSDPFFVPLKNIEKTNQPLLSENTTFSSDHAETDPLTVSIDEAILLTLENNNEFQSQRLVPDIRKTAEVEQQAEFDPSLSMDFTKSRDVEKTDTDPETTTDSLDTQITLSTPLPTGTEVKLGLSSTVTESSDSDKQSRTRGELTITQALLEGFGLDVNLASVRQARIDTLVSHFELRGAAEALVAEVETTCWDLLLAQQRIAIFNDSLKLAEDQLQETRQRIAIGKLAAVELYASEAEVALRREDLIDARSSLALTRLKLQGLLNLPGENKWDQKIIITDAITVPTVTLDDPATHVKIGMKWRPERHQAHLEMRRGDLEIVKTKNGLLPVLDFFITLAKNGYADSFTNSIDDLDGDSYDIMSGLHFTYPFRNRGAEARHNRAGINRQLAQIAFDNLSKLVEIDIRSALIEVNRMKEQITATAATRKLQEESLKGETEKFRVGKSTALLVAQAQRDFIVSQIAEVEAVVNYLKSLTELYKHEGSLLARRGIITPEEQHLGFQSDQVCSNQSKKLQPNTAKQR